MFNALHYNQLLSPGAFSGMHSSSSLPCTSDESPWPYEIWGQSEEEYMYMGANSTSGPFTIPSEDHALLADYRPMQLPPATPFLSGTPLPNFDIDAFGSPFTESCLSSYFLGSRCAESGIVPFKQSCSDGRSTSFVKGRTPSAGSPSSPNANRLKGEGSSSHKKLKRGRARCTKQPSKLKPELPAFKRKKKATNSPEPLLASSSDWLNDADINEDDSSEPRSLIHGRQVCTGSKNLLYERKRRIKLNEKLLCLRTMVPRISKMDKAAIVADAIDYVKDLHKQLKNTQEDILAIQAGTYVPTQEVLSSDSTKGVHAQPHKQADIPQHKIIEMQVLSMEPKMYLLCVHCKRGQGVLLQITKALEALDLKILSANLATVLDLVINTIVIKLDKVSKVEDLEDLMKKTFPSYGLNF